ncbi:TPA: toprim domain-containing protein, partial [Escherichia coli]|nr:toprim domain-containing protein [Escherichia coli]HDW9012528.1 toprim domain-containing protein [Escherichia coli]HDW9017489.1 toprim domain-containing protein [Escherichia coli]HDW9057434.1 toprim domain-containing protein [Escherichia coli]
QKAASSLTLQQCPSVQYWKFTEERDKVDEQGRPIRDAEGKTQKVSVELERPRVFFATVFNAQQIEGLPPLELKPQQENEWEAVERAEHILKASGARITHAAGDRAFYRPSTDSITLPEKSQFPQPDAYYATALHELGHWTGHPTRLDRDLAHPFGSEGYAKEELRAEISSMILGDSLGIGHDPEQHAAYVGSWIKVLQDDPLEIFRASSDAEKIHDYVLAFEQKQVQELERDEDLALNQELRENGQQIVSHMEAQDRWGKGERIYAFHDQDGEPHLVRSLDELDKYAPDQMLALPALVLEQNEVNTMTANIDNLPGSLVDRLVDNGIMTRPDAEATSALRDLHAGTESTRAVDAQAFKEASEKAFGFALPQDWGGNIQVQGCVYEMIDGERHVTAANAIGKEPEFWGVYAELESGLHEWVADFDSQQQADELAMRLEAVDAYAEVNDIERAAKLALLHEEKVRRDPNSTSEDISAAKDARKKAQMAVMLNDRDFQKSIAEHERNQQETAQGATAPAAQQKAEREYINVPFKEKNEAKGLGARWDRQQQSWYVPPGVDTARFAKWKQEAAATEGQQRQQAQQTQPQQREYLAVPYEQRNEAKAAGARWDKVAKSWYVGPNADRAALERWKPENVTEQDPAMTPREEFAEAMKSAGLFVGERSDGSHPIMDGKPHRVPVDGGKAGAVDGFYVGHLDGHPAGRIINNKTGTDVTWKSKGYALSDEERAKMQAEAATKLAERAAEQAKQQEATAQRVTNQMSALVPIEQPTPYLAAKGIQPKAGVMTDQEGQKTFIPAFDTDGKQWTMQYIQEDGTKRFAKNSKKEGCFHPVGGMDALAAAPTLVIAEGYATAAQLAEAVGHATVASFDSGNLENVAKALHEKYPDKPVIVAGDDDRHLVMTHGKNPGREKAEAAAQAVGGKAIFPVFAPSENTYPSDLPPITPDAYKAHLRASQRLEDAAEGKLQLGGDEVSKLKATLLSSEQVEALSTMKRHTDFNDLAQKSELGREGVKRQVVAAVSKAQQDQLYFMRLKHATRKRQEKGRAAACRVT